MTATIAIGGGSTYSFTPIPVSSTNTHLNKVTIQDRGGRVEIFNHTPNPRQIMIAMVDDPAREMPSARELCGDALVTLTEYVKQLERQADDERAIRFSNGFRRDPHVMSAWKACGRCGGDGREGFSDGCGGKWTERCGQCSGRGNVEVVI